MRAFSCSMSLLLVLSVSAICVDGEVTATEFSSGPSPLTSTSASASSEENGQTSSEEAIFAFTPTESVSTMAGVAVSVTPGIESTTKAGVCSEGENPIVDVSTANVKPLS
ncbi:hypothetical protein BIW11_00477 [Tropilaelaps mercedesae]|uniref:Uncharacterized protein n=1 Tax=Tropilaelaps mercedesae TaxID=418985 RepID=A0A1V9XUR3_9ACAR|nr:hypothetical protein BIW11_00477 [Tropilaelaps mercedesae]